jgi:hypothetical protein
MRRIASQALLNAINGVTPTMPEIVSRIPAIARKPRKTRKPKAEKETISQEEFSRRLDAACEN